MKKQQIHTLTSKIHKWAGLTIGIQVLLWLAGGFVMSWFDIEAVRGEHLVHHPNDVVVSNETYNFKAVDKFVTDSKRPIKFVFADGLNGEPVFKISYMDGGNEILHPLTAASLSPVPKAYVERVATALYAGSGKIIAAKLKDKTGVEYRGPLPIWQVDFSDDENTSLYFNPDTGKMMAVRSDLWRFYDFMWMLHIMDYETRDDFNHPLLYLFALAALLFSLSGFVLVYFRFTKRDFKWIRTKK